MNKYRCGRCHEELQRGIKGDGGLQCDKCGWKVFYKERPYIKKTIKAR